MHPLYSSLVGLVEEWDRLLSINDYLGCKHTQGEAVKEKASHAVISLPCHQCSMHCENSRLAHDAE